MERNGILQAIQENSASLSGNIFWPERAFLPLIKTKCPIDKFEVLENPFLSSK